MTSSLISPVDPEPVLAAEPLGRVVEDPVLALELLQPCERPLGGADARPGLFLIGAAVLLQAEEADQPG